MPPIETKTFASLYDTKIAAPAQGQSLAYDGNGRLVNVPARLNVRAFGAKGDGVTDDTAAVNLAITAAFNVGGGTIYFPRGTYLVLGQLLIPDQGSGGGNHFGTIRLTGDGPWGAGGSVTTSAGFGTNLDLRYGTIRSVADGATTLGSPTLTSATASFTSADVGRFVVAVGVPWRTQILSVTNGTTVTLSSNASATATGVSVTLNEPKIYSPGAGLLEIDHLNLVDGGTDSAPYVLVTKTVLKAHDLRVEGNPSKSTSTCDQDVFLLGGTLTTYNHTPNDQFSGYIAQVSNVIFSRIRAGVVARTFANSVLTEKCWFDGTCGGAVGAAALEAWAPTGQNTVGFTSAFNYIECNSYTYGVNLTNAAAAQIIGTQFYDSGSNVNFVACVNADAQSTNTLLTIGYRDISRGVAIQDASNTARVFDATSGLQWSNNLKFDTSGNINQTGGGVITTNGAVRAVAITDLNNNRASLSTNTDATHSWVLTSLTTGKAPLSVFGAAGQTANIFEWGPASGTSTIAVDKDGLLNANAPKVFNVRAPKYGAKGDGSTDDSTAINSAEADAAVSGGVVYFPPGNYLCNSDVLFTGNYVTFRGSGRDNTILSFATGKGLKNSGAAQRLHCNVEELSIAGNAGTVATNGVGLDFNEVHWSTISRVRIYNFTTGIRVAANTFGAYMTRIDACRVTGCQTGILLTGTLGANATTILGGEVSSNTTAGIQIDNATNGCTVLGTDIESNAIGIKCDGQGNFFRAVRYEGNTTDTSFTSNSQDNLLETASFDSTKHADAASNAYSNKVVVTGWTNAFAEAREWIQTLDPRTIAASCVCEVANNAYFAKVVPKRLTKVSAISFVPTVQSGNVDVGISLFGGIPLATSGSTAVGAINTLQTINLTAPVWLEPNREYYFILAFDNNTAAFFGASGNSASLAAQNADFLAKKKATMFPLTGNSTSGASSTTLVPWLRAS